MSNLDTTVETTRPNIRRSKKSPSLMIDGAEWKPRKYFADDVGLCDLSIKKMNLRTVYHGGVAYVCVQEGLRAIVARARQYLEKSRVFGWSDRRRQPPIATGT